MRRNKFFVSILTIFIFTLFLSHLLFAQKNPKDKFEFPKLNEIKLPKVEQVTLKNGMQLFLVEDHNYPTVDMRAMIHTGSVYEPADKVGLAAITGAVLRSGGTRSMTGDEIDKKLETMAASIESGIGRTSGYVSVSMLKQDVDKVLPILAEVLMYPKFADEKIELEKVQQRTAISRRNDDIGQITNREFYKLIYGAESPYARHAEYATVDAITRDDIVAFYNRFYAPNNMMIAVWGDFKTKEMVKKIKQTFANWNQKELDIPPLPEVKYQFEYSVNFIDKPDVNQSNIMMGHIGGLKNNPDYPALTIMNRILSFDRMFKKIRTSEGLAYSVWGSYGSNYKYPGVFTAGAQTKSRSTVYAIELMLKEMKRIMNEEVTDEELQRAKDQYLNSFVFNFDSKAKIVNRMLTYAFYGYPMDFAEQVKQKIEKVTKAEIMRVAKEYLRPDKVKILVVGNKEEFEKPLSTLGEVKVIDITIPKPVEETPEATTETLKQGLDLLRKTMAAMGGEEKLKAIQNQWAKLAMTQVTPMGEMSIDTEMTVVYPDKIHMVMNTPQGEMTMIINGEKGVMKMGDRSMPLSAQQRDAIVKNVKRNLIYLLQNLDKFKTQFIGETTFGEANAVDVLISENVNQFHLYIDPNTFLPLGKSYQETIMTGPAKVEEFFQDYQDFSGIKLAAKTVNKADGKKINESLVKEMKLNVEIDENLFKVE